MSPHLPGRSDIPDLDPGGSMKSRAARIMDHTLELAAEEQVSISSDSDEEEATVKPNASQRRQVQNAKFDALYVE